MCVVREESLFFCDEEFLAGGFSVLLRVEYRDGLYLPDIDLWLDPARARALPVIAHGHSDHIAEHRAIIATPATARIFRHRCGEAEVESLPYTERRDYGR